MLIEVNIKDFLFKSAAKCDENKKVNNKPLDANQMKTTNMMEIVETKYLRIICFHSGFVKSSFQF